VFSVLNCRITTLAAVLLEDCHVFAAQRSHAVRFGDFVRLC
jgi:hypothetical protein